MKTHGVLTVRLLIARTRKLAAMERIASPDAEFIVDRLQQVEARIINMAETNEKGEEL
jgi:hypothetical protein